VREIQQDTQAERGRPKAPSRDRHLQILVELMHKFLARRAACGSSEGTWSYPLRQVSTCWGQSLNPPSSKLNAISNRTNDFDGRRAFASIRALARR
jgi:hypothetical protein